MLQFYRCLQSKQDTNIKSGLKKADGSDCASCFKIITVIFLWDYRKFKYLQFKFLIRYDLTEAVSTTFFQVDHYFSVLLPVFIQTGGLFFILKAHKNLLTRDKTGLESCLC